MTKRLVLAVLIAVAILAISAAVRNLVHPESSGTALVVYTLMEGVLNAAVIAIFGLLTFLGAHFLYKWRRRRP